MQTTDRGLVSLVSHGLTHLADRETMKRLDHCCWLCSVHEGCKVTASYVQPQLQMQLQAWENLNLMCIVLRQEKSLAVSFVNESYLQLSSQSYDCIHGLVMKQHVPEANVCWSQVDML